MQIEIYDLKTNGNGISVELTAICDSFSSLLWDIEYYTCGCFEIYISANPENVNIFQLGRIVACDDDSEHFGIIENIKIETNTETGDYLTVSGRFLTCLLERRIIYPTMSVSGNYGFIIQSLIKSNCIDSSVRTIPGLALGDVTGKCWERKTRLQVSYDNLLEYIYKLCEIVGGSINIKNDGNALVCDLFQGTDRSILQNNNPHIVFSDDYNNLLSFTYAADNSIQKNFAYVFGCGEGSACKKITFYNGTEPAYFDRYEVYSDQHNLTQDDKTSDSEYLEMLIEKGKESIVMPQSASESTIAPFSTQFEYNKDYFVGDYVTVENKRFGLIQKRIQLVGMIESFDQNGRSLTPTFKEG